MAKVGKPLIDIDVPEEVVDAVEENQAGPKSGVEAGAESVLGEALGSTIEPPSKSELKKAESGMEANTGKPVERTVSKHASLATPAVRHISKELGVDITSISGTGKDGRVTKDDVYQFAKLRDSGASQAPAQASDPVTQNAAFLRQAPDHGPQVEESKSLTNVQAMMFKSMTASLNIPHFLYADEVDVSALFALRKRVNKMLKKAPTGDVEKISTMPFLIKAMSLAMDKYPIINARVDASGPKPQLVMRKQHNIGVAMDTPSGLVVPVIKNVGALNVLSIAQELHRLQNLAKAGKLSNADLSGGTITLSNIGNIGGTYVSPVIVEKEVAILGIGKMRAIPAFGEDGQIVKKEVMNFSWSADHRVVDGATMAKAAEVVRGFVEEPDMMLVHLH